MSLIFADIDYLSPDCTVEHGCIGIQGDRVTYIGSQLPENLDDFQEVYDGRGRLLIPGMYNIHAHAPMTLLRGYAENMVLQEWLYNKVFPFEGKMTGPDNYYGSLLAIAEMLRFGVVSYSDMYFETDDRIRAVAESGIKANVCPALMVFDQEVVFSDLEESITNARYVKEFHNSQAGRIRIDLNIHSEYISNPQVVRAVGEQAVELGVGTHIHISETKQEHEDCKDRRGMSPAAYFEGLDFFKAPCTAAHAVWTEPDDWEVFSRNAVSVAANPASNLKLASGFAPIPEMIAAGVNVGIGTDGMASNNNHNMLQDVYLLATVYKASSDDPTVISPAQAMQAATLNGARAQGRKDCGSIALGNKADLVVMDTDVPWMYPQTSKLNNLVYSALGSDVILTMVDGEVLYRNGQWQTIDIERVKHEALSAVTRIISGLA
ncbi:MAG: amidohydrolase [Coriobacteriia bacterium]|nr:amidohydrolase [Coriobacteriia bacterium]